MLFHWYGEQFKYRKFVFKEHSLVWRQSSNSGICRKYKIKKEAHSIKENHQTLL